MMERFQDAEFSWHSCPQKTVTIPRSVCVLYLLFTQPSLIRSFHSSDPVSPCLAQRGSDMRGSTVVGMSQLGKSTLSRSNRCKIILALKDHSFVESCCIKLLYDCEKEMLLIPEILDAIDLRVLRLEGVHRPRVSTTRGKKEPPAATTWASWRMSLSIYIYIYIYIYICIHFRAILWIRNG